MVEVTRLLSNLYKSGFQNLVQKDADPFLLDVSKRKLKVSKPASGSDKPAKVIRPLEEQSEEEQEEIGANHVILTDAMDKAKVVRDDAMIKAAKIISDAEEEAKAILEQAKQEGYNQGFEQGSMEAMKRADAYIEKMQSEQEDAAAKNREEMEQYISHAKQSMVDVACDLIAKLTGILVNDYKPVMLHMINNALNESDTSKKFVIHVSEEIYQYIEDNKSSLVGAANPNIAIEIYGDSKMGRSECLIDTDNGIIDLSMEVQVRNLVTAIKLLSD